LEWRPAPCNSGTLLWEEAEEDPQAPLTLGRVGQNGDPVSTLRLKIHVIGQRESSADQFSDVVSFSFFTRPSVKISDDGRFRLSRSGPLDTTGARAPRRHRPRFRASLPTVRSESHGGRERVGLQVRDELERRDGDFFLEGRSSSFTADLPRLFRVVPRTRRTETRPRAAETTRPLPGDAQRFRRRHGRSTRLEAAQDLGGRLPRARRHHGHV
jgi:hypothetical protein